MHKGLHLMGTGDACQYLGITQSRLHKLVVFYKIPHHKTSAGMIFEKEDLDAFQKSRADRMKHGNRPNSGKK